MSAVFDAYARYYDLLYRDKDYAGESAYVAARLRAGAPQAVRILDLGCGTGAHAEHLARMGYEVHGVDVSEAMIARALERKQSLPTEIAARLTFERGDVRSFRKQERFDAVVSLFHVLSYQTENGDVRAMFETAAHHLGAGGVFLFDFWYGPAVLTERPSVRVKRLEDEEIKVTRIAEPVMHVNDNTVDVNYSVFIESKRARESTCIAEKHTMRYFFLPELALYYASKFERVSATAWMTEREPSGGDWAACVMLARRDDRSV